MNVSTSVANWCASDISGYIAHDSAHLRLLKRNINLYPKNKWHLRMAGDCSSPRSLLRSDSSNSLSDPYLPTSHSLVISPKQQRVAYYKFDNDDKYFLLNDSDVGFQDSELYASFYRSLPPARGLNQQYLQIRPHTLIVLPRNQYGHYLLDELLPALVISRRLNMSVSGITVLYNQPWQCEVATECHRLLDCRTPLLLEPLAPVSAQLVFPPSSFAIPCFPEIFQDIRSHLTSAKLRKYYQDGPQLLPLCYITREGFGDSDRVHNRNTIYRQLSETCDFPLIYPHELSLTRLIRELSSYSTVIADPGTTTLIAFLFANPWANVYSLASSRCLTDCSKQYYYSGWRYHIAYADIAYYCWGKPLVTFPNPFSDICIYNSINADRIL